MAQAIQPIRIARVITRFGVGGVERHVSMLTEHLDRNKFQNWVIYGRAGSSERECLEFSKASAVNTILIDNLKRNLGIWDISASFKLHRVLALIKPQIVETHQSKAGALGRSMARLGFRAREQRPRLIHTFHCHQFEGYFSSPVAKCFVLIERALARLTDLIITVSPSIRRALIERYQIAQATKVRVVPLGFDFGWVQDVYPRRGWLRARLGVDDSAVIFGFVGRLTMIKNIEMLLKSFAQMLRETRLNARLAIIGDGELRPTLESLVQNLNIKEQVVFCGWVLDRAAIYSDFDVTCLSSHNEGSPVCLIESLAAGIPVISTDVGGVSDIVTSPCLGELVKAGDSDAYAAALSRLAMNPRLISKAESKSVRDRFSIKRVAQDMESIYFEILETTPHSTGGSEPRIQPGR